MWVDAHDHLVFHGGSAAVSVERAFEHALVAAHGSLQRGSPIVVGATKASLGHSEAVSGQVGLLRVAEGIGGAKA